MGRTAINCLNSVTGMGFISRVPLSSMMPPRLPSGEERPPVMPPDLTDLEPVRVCLEEYWNGGGWKATKLCDDAFYESCRCIDGVLSPGDETLRAFLNRRVPIARMTRGSGFFLIEAFPSVQQHLGGLVS